MKKYPIATIRISQDLLDRIDIAVRELNYRSRSAYIIDALALQLWIDEERQYGKPTSTHDA